VAFDAAGKHVHSDLGQQLRARGFPPVQESSTAASIINTFAGPTYRRRCDGGLEPWRQLWSPSGVAWMQPALFIAEPRTEPFAK